MTAQTGLRCPKDQSLLTSYGRNGVTIDRRMGCGGIFLDRGELECLIDAEGRFNDEQGRRDQEYGKGAHAGGDGQRQRRGSFLGDLLDFS